MATKTVAHGSEGNKILIDTLEELLEGLKKGGRPWLVLLHKRGEQIELASNVDEAPRDLQRNFAAAMQNHGRELDTTGW